MNVFLTFDAVSWNCHRSNSLKAVVFITFQIEDGNHVIFKEIGPTVVAFVGLNQLVDHLPVQSLLILEQPSQILWQDALVNMVVEGLEAGMDLDPFSNLLRKNLHAKLINGPEYSGCIEHVDTNYSHGQPFLKMTKACLVLIHL